MSNCALKPGVGGGGKPQRSVLTSRNARSASPRVRSLLSVCSDLLEVLTEVPLIPTGSCCHGCVSASELPGMVFPWTQIEMALGSEV